MKTLAITTAAAAVAMGGLAWSVPSDSSAQVQTRVAPRGSYAQSCSGSYVNQGRLYADCRDMRGQMRGTSIELNRCANSDIGNDNGRLVCQGWRGDMEDDRPGQNGGWGNGGRPPGGGWGGNNGGGWGNGGGWNNGRQSITVYRDSNYRGDSRTFNGEVPDLKQHGFNDVVSSMRFQGSWEACTDSYFRGDCEVFHGDVRTLSRYYNDKISSLRPVRGGRDRY